MFRAIAVAAVSAALLVPSIAGAKDAKKGATSVLVTPSDLKWVDTPDSPGVQIAAVSGDPT